MAEPITLRRVFFDFPVRKNRQGACTALGDYGEGSAFVVAVVAIVTIAVGGQVNSRSLTFLPLRLIHAYELWLCFQSLCSLDLDLNRVFARFLGRNRLGNRHIDFRHSSPSSPIPKYRDIWTKTLWIPIKISVWRKTDNIGDISPILSAFSSMGTISIRYICPSFWSGALSF
ncbi:uncharacterized protein LOC126617692 isoform X1 [Malus sylvestris]|uniref:uncharacterized protein LOC126617692 isoform X1 n=1 Tax=Malus sylvestris TaxID=3752 RepID=UPI0021AC3537|nr:uncharacterized protein LOC126617692 isoform X1 [Malus sylvestris]